MTRVLQNMRAVKLFESVGSWYHGRSTGPPPAFIADLIQRDFEESQK
jgi:hypothetical protein